MLLMTVSGPSKLFVWCSIQVDKWFCYIAGNFFPAVFTLIGYFEVTWQVTMKLFQAKIFEWATLQNKCTVTHKCWPMTTIAASLMNFQLQNFQLYNKSLKDWCQGKQLICFLLNLNVSLGFPSETLRFLGDNSLSPSRPVVKCLL